MVLEHRGGQGLIPTVLGALHRIAALADHRSLHAEVTHQPARPGPGRDQCALRLTHTPTVEMGGDHGAEGKTRDPGVNHLSAGCHEGRHQRIAGGLGLADLGRAGKADPCDRCARHHRRIGGQIGRLHRLETRAARRRTFPGPEALFSGPLRHPDQGVAIRSDDVGRAGELRQPAPGRQGMGEDTGQGRLPAPVPGRVRGCDEAQRPGPPKAGISPTEVQRSPEAEQTAGKGAQALPRGQGRDLLGCDMADVAERGRTARIARVDQGHGKARRLQPQGRRGPDQAAADDEIGLGLHRTPVASTSGSYTIMT